MIDADPNGSYFAYQAPDRTVRVFGLDGAPDGPPIPSGFRSLATVALAPRRHLVFIANFDRGTIKCFDWRTGEPLWLIRDGFKQLGVLHCLGDGPLLANQMSGRLTAIDPDSGRILDSMGGVQQVHANSGSGWIIATRRRPDRLCFHKGFRSEPYWTFDTGTMEFEACANEAQAVVAQSGGLVKCFDLHRGIEQWRYDCGEGRGLTWLAQPPGSGVVFGIRHHMDAGGFGDAILLDQATGRLVRETPLDFALGAVVDGGRAAVNLEQLVHLPDLVRRPHVARPSAQE